MVPLMRWALEGGGIRGSGGGREIRRGLRAILGIEKTVEEAELDVG